MKDYPSEVIILGAGISGMLAAWACERRDRSFVIVDKGPAEVLPRLVKGCVYLHDLCDIQEIGWVRSQHLMTSILPVWGAGSLSYLYHAKIWGHEVPYEPNSVDEFDVTCPLVFSMNDALRLLHERYRGHIDYRSVSMVDVQEYLRRGHKVVSTVPLGALFPDAQLISKPLWTWQSVMDPLVYGQSAWVVYNVASCIAWYRMTSMFGNMAIEFIRPPQGDWKVAKFLKIMSHDMSEKDAMHPYLLFTGRWGRWQRGFLSHQTYREVLRKFDSGEWR